MKDVVIGLDIGTSSIKAAGFDLTGRLLSKARQPIQIYSPVPGWAEQDPHDWWKSVCTVLNTVLQDIPPQRVAALGFAGQCPGHVLMDAHHKPIGNAIIWRDQRATDEAGWLGEHMTTRNAIKWVGMETPMSAAAQPTRLLWLRKHRPQDWDQAVAVLQPKDYIALLLTGNLSTDFHSAFGLANPVTGNYEPAYFDLLQIPLSKMPAVVGATEIIGTVTEIASEAVGLAVGTPIVIGTIDAYCDNIAAGINYPGTAVDVTGTSEIVSLAVSDHDQPGPMSLARMADGITFLCGPTQAGGETLIWLQKCMFGEFSSAANYAILEEEAGSIPPGSDGLVFLPYLNGERAPIWDPNARGAFIGLTFDHNRRHYTRAVYESIGYAIRHILESYEDRVGIKAQEMAICGGGSVSDFWNQIKANILQRPVKPTVVSETGCLGAAILASVGIGRFSNIAKASEKMVHFRTRLEPEKMQAEIYDRGYQAYRSYYLAIRPVLEGSGIHEGRRL